MKAPKKPVAWEKLLTTRKTREGRVVVEGTFHNAALIVQNDLAGCFGWDEFRSCVVVRERMPDVAGFEAQVMGQSEGAPLDKPDVDLVVAWLAREWSLDLGHGVVAQAITMAARAVSEHPVVSWLAGLRWDGTPRLDGWLVDLCGCADTPYTRKVGAWFLCAMVGRVCVPGCKHDEMLVLEGRQGVGKSTVFRVLAGEWFSDSPLDLESKDRYVALRGNWVVEVAELDGFTRHEVTKVKAYMTSAVDDYRAPYAAQNTKVPRQCVFAGTVNAAEYLHDVTGGRRFYPVRVGRVDLAGLAMVREQLFAEALIRWREGTAWRFEGEDYDRAREEQEARRVADVWESGIGLWCDGAVAPITTQRILAEHIGLTRERWGRTEESRVGKCLTALGWHPHQIRHGATRVRAYFRNGTCTHVDCALRNKASPPSGETEASHQSQPVTTGTRDQGCDTSEAEKESFA